MENDVRVVAVSDGCCYMVHRALKVSKVQQQAHRFSEPKSSSSGDLFEISGPTAMDATKRHVQQRGNKKTSEQTEQPAQWGRAWWVFVCAWNFMLFPDKIEANRKSHRSNNWRLVSD